MINKKSAPILVNYTKLRKRLMIDYNYTRQEVVHTLWRLINACDEVKDAFADWYLHDKDVSLKCQDITWNDMVEKKGLNPFNAFLYMDTLIKNPELGVNLLPAQMRPSMKISVDKLRPELRDYVNKKSKENKSPLMGVYMDPPAEAKGEFDPKDGEEINLNAEK